MNSAKGSRRIAYRGVRKIGDIGTGNRRRSVFPLSRARNKRGEGKALKTLPENDLGKGVTH
jgi:hypothetical protein